MAPSTSKIATIPPAILSTPPFIETVDGAAVAAVADVPPPMSIPLIDMPVVSSAAALVVEVVSTGIEITVTVPSSIDVVAAVAGVSIATVDDVVAVAAAIWVPVEDGSSPLEAEDAPDLYVSRAPDGAFMTPTIPDLQWLPSLQ